MTAVEVCLICDIAECRHIRERKAKMTATDEELDALAAEAMDRSIERLRELAAYAGRPSWEKILREELSAPITALRAQRAEAWAAVKLTAEISEKAFARADRAEAALAAQIEADAGFVIAMKGNGWDENPATHPYDKGYIAACDTAISRICLQPHDRTALDRMLRAEREKALREAADELKGQGYNTAVRQILAMIDKEGG